MGRPLAGIVAVATAISVISVAVGMFRGDFTSSVAVTVLSPRAGLVMNPDAKVQMRGIQVGTVAAIEALSDGQAALHLALDPSQLELIPRNVLVDITSSTVFGAKYVDLVPPPNPSAEHLDAGAVLDAKNVTVEINTVFEQLSTVLAKLNPVKLNQTLAAIASGLSGRGAKLGQSLTDLDHYLAGVDPSLSTLSLELQNLPLAVNAYADAAPDLLSIADNSRQVSQTLIDRQQDLDALLLASIGLAEAGNQVVGENGQPFTDVMHLLLPTTDLLNQYRQALNCGLQGIGTLAKAPPLPVPGAMVSISFVLGAERYRYPGNLPKVAATGGPQCAGLPTVPPNTRAPFVVADVGSNPWQYGNQGILLNSDGLKQLLFGPIDGPPRNTAQIGQPG
nr:MCE family protein [Mycobacterium aquaticum]